MNIYKYSIFLVLIAFSCESIDHEDLQGYWTQLPSEKQKLNFREVRIDGNLITFMDSNYFISSDSFKIDENKIRLNSLENFLDCRKPQQDTLTLNGERYVSSEKVFFPDEYEIIGISTGLELGNSTSYYKILHAYRDSIDTFRIRSHDKYISTENIKFAVSNSSGHTPHPDTAIFIGENLKLLDLKSIYYELLDMNIRDVYLILDYTFPHNYDVFKDHIEIWWQDLNNHLLKKYNQEMPKEYEKYYLSKTDLNMSEVDNIIIENQDDFHKLNKLDKGNVTLISVDSSMKIQDYVSLKMKIAELRKEKIQLITEISQ